ncbi:SPFH domain-containing protein [Desulfobacterales bacterium HSG16]|nr:SPFH domain-containing protein [Desulfobacterales bacterium HSG16]
MQDIIVFITGIGGFLIVGIGCGLLIMLIKCYRKVEQGQALIRNGMGGTKVTFSGMVVIPILHRSEMIEISLKRVIIDRHGSEGLICQDNMRADIKVVFFVRVNKTEPDVLKVAQTVGCDRASHQKTIQELFDAKFSEALKTVGKQFDFVDLYNSREKFKDEILNIIGTDLNGFVLDDAAIDYLEQTNLDMLNEFNILDSEGIRKITELTSKQKIQSNQLARGREKTITQQDVEAKEAILVLNKQLAEAENQQRREIESIKAREDAEIEKVQHEEHLKSENARISMEEEVNVAEENKQRQIIVAQKNKEKTEAVETERIEKDRMLEANERERLVSLAQIEKDKAIEIERKAIQDVIRERVAVEKTVVIEQEKIKDTEAFAGADREKKVVMTHAEKEAEEKLIKDIKGAEAEKKVAALQADKELYKVVKSAEANRQAADLKAEEVVIEAEAYQSAAEKKSAAKKMLAEAEIEEKAAPGLAEVKVAQSQADAIEKRGAAEAKVIDNKGTAEAKVLELKNQVTARSIDNKGTAEAKVQALKFQSEAKGIENKANAMKLLDAVGREHEEFKLRLNKEKDIELAAINVQKEVAENQAVIIGEALKSAKVDIIGGETTFFDRIVNAVSAGKAVDRLVTSSKTISDVKETFFNADPNFFRSQIKDFFTQFGLSSEDFKNLSISAALTQLLSIVEKPEDRSQVYDLMALAEKSGLKDRMLSIVDTKPVKKKKQG